MFFAVPVGAMDISASTVTARLRPHMAWVWGAAVSLCVGCGAHDRAVDPDAHEHEAKAQLAPLPTVALATVIGALAGVPEGDAPEVLEGWLGRTADGRRLLSAWPRRHDGHIDPNRTPVRLISLEASIEPGSKSRCGEITMVFGGEARIDLRMRLPIPATTPMCRGTLRASRVEGGEAAPLLRAAIAEARVPDEPTAVARND
jgi:hypothetical protein